MGEHELSEMPEPARDGHCSLYADGIKAEIEMPQLGKASAYQICSRVSESVVALVSKMRTKVEFGKIGCVVCYKMKPG